MNREIKFRAWDKESNKMRYFDEVGYCDEYNHLSFRLSDESREVNGGSYGNLCGKDIDDFSELMQFTGLFDKNGKEIYEGDVVKCDIHFKGGFLPHIGRIVYDNEFSAFATRNSNETNTLLHNIYLPSIEVIGNIYENPELLK